MLRRLGLLTLILTLAAAPAFALFPGTDLLVTAAARGGGFNNSLWITDLYIYNPGTQTANVTISWMARGVANTNPATRSFTIDPGESLFLDDVIKKTFGKDGGGGAFRVVANRTVVVNSRIFNLKEGVSFGQGFEGLPRNLAVQSGASTDVVGLAESTTFRTNLVLMDASGSGSTVDLTLIDASGSQFGTKKTVTLQAFEPSLPKLTDLFPAVGTFDNATLHAQVTSGSAFVMASKIDNDQATGDPTTLESWQVAGGAASADGTYHFAVYDSEDFATGGNVVVTDDKVVSLIATYNNYDKVDSGGFSECTLLFPLEIETFDPPVSLADFANGYSFVQYFIDSGEISFTFTFTVNNNMSLVGTVDAVGANFPSDPDPNIDENGCNGTFPPLTLLGGKVE